MNSRQPSTSGSFSPMIVQTSQPPSIDHELQRYPYCIVWTPLPVITWFFPFIGHTGIGDSSGTLYDFAGPYTIGVGKLTFSPPTKFLQLDPTRCTTNPWDEGVRVANRIYKGRMHNICCDNCHSHVAQALNVMGYDQHSNYGMLQVGVWMFFQARFVSFSSCLQTYLPFLILITTIFLFCKYF
jgi:transmembrane protein 222